MGNFSRACNAQKYLDKFESLSASTSSTKSALLAMEEGSWSKHHGTCDRFEIEFGGVETLVDGGCQKRMGMAW